MRSVRASLEAVAEAHNRLAQHHKIAKPWAESSGSTYSSAEGHTWYEINHPSVGPQCMLNPHKGVIPTGMHGQYLGLHHH